MMFHNARDAFEFTLAGNAILTISSLKTGARYTYRVHKAERGEVWFVSLLTGPNNDADYTYVGLIRKHNSHYAFGLTRASRLPEDATPVAAFRFFLRHLSAGQIAPHLEVRHEGRCGRCNRRLTVPESLDRGIGPECAGIMRRAA